MVARKIIRQIPKSRHLPVEGSASATLRHIRVSPQKMRLMVNLIKGKQLEPAEQILKFNPKKTARILLKVLASAKYNAREVKGLDIDRLWVTGGWVNGGKSLKRWLPRAHGRATSLIKRSSHVTIVLSEK
ncbi:MAG: 50S ribosomal protein L22 [SAR324 cluster bacterium]|uniref:Large ribosomal subunit protein uL22 n=1 Tax=SAR324 cluster bacterium TaxID=2024889 RepID=A0A7X9FP27_9DELT|nr:50S ribosomal protein L22 [SAR324 cluster bacterium]